MEEASQYLEDIKSKLIASSLITEFVIIEIKSFFGGSAISQFHTALGQFLNYQIILESEDRDRMLYLAIPIKAYEAFFRFEPVKTAIIVACNNL